MHIEKRINAFQELGIVLSKTLKGQNKHFKNLLDEAIIQAEIKNRWFIKPFTIHMLQAVANALDGKNLQTWISAYPALNSSKAIKNIGVVLAGNIPLVGFHDMLCVLMSGNNFIGKLSTKDEVLLQVVVAILCDIEPEFRKKIIITEENLKNFDAIIATGSNNTSRYFEHYFGKYPNIIRRNRNSLAILSGNETKEELENLADDIFLYYGLGCRNVAKIFVPHNYNFQPLFDALEKYRFVIDNHKYANNYHYYKSIYLMNNEPFSDNGFVLLKPDSTIHSPIANIFYEYYKNTANIEQYIMHESNNIQCIATNKAFSFNTVNFGDTQHPQLWDYSDNIDTFAFLLNL